MFFITVLKTVFENTENTQKVFSGNSSLFFKFKSIFFVFFLFFRNKNKSKPNMVFLFLCVFCSFVLCVFFKFSIFLCRNQTCFFLFSLFLIIQNCSKIVNKLTLNFGFSLYPLSLSLSLFSLIPLVYFDLLKIKGLFGSWFF